MKSGGTDISNDIWRIFKLLGLIVPVVLLVYNSLLIAEPAFAAARFDVTFSYVFIFLWMLLSFGLLFSNSRPQAQKLYVIIYHILATVYAIQIGGIQAPTLLFWALLITIAYVLFGNRGNYFSISLLLFVFIAHSILVQSSLATLTIEVFYVATTILVGTACTYIVRIQETQKKHLIDVQLKEQHQKNSMTTLINNLSDAVLSLDSKGKIQLYNAAVLGLLDTNAQMLSFAIDKVLKLEGEDGKKIPLLPLLKSATGIVVRDDVYLSIGSERIRIEITYSPIRSSYQTSDMHDTDGFVLIFRDVTKAKSLEEERDEFISVVSHELRTPIAITEGALDNARLIFEKDASKIEAVNSALTMAHDQVIFLSRMVNDLSTLSRAERGVADEAEIIDITELANTLHSEYTSQAEAKKLHFNLHAKGSLGQVKASRLYLQELLQNFITNSIKYTKEGHVDLVIERHKDDITFAVTDSGIGISKSDQKKIFDKFYRSEDYRTRETGGTGLGLYVAQKLSKKLQCTIELKSRLNHGSTFSFSLPAAKDESAKEQTKA